MGVDELLTELRRLDRADKLRAMEVLVTELTSEEGGSFVPGGEYQVWSPHDAAEAAVVLNRLLESEGAENTDRRA